MDLSYDSNHLLAERFREFIRDGAFPCLGAKSAVGRNQLRLVIARDINSAWDGGPAGDGNAGAVV